MVKNLEKENEILELLKNMNSKLDEHTKILGEHTLILRALEHSSEVHKAEMDKLNHSISRVEGEVKGIREDLTAVELITSKNWNEITKLKAVK